MPTKYGFYLMLLLNGLYVIFKSYAFYGYGGHGSFSIFYALVGHVRSLVGVVQGLQRRGGINATYRSYVRNGPSCFISRRLCGGCAIIKDDHYVSTVSDLYHCVGYALGARYRVYSMGVVIGNL